MKAFIATRAGYVLADEVTGVTNDGSQLKARGGAVLPASDDATQTILQVIPVAGEWEVVWRDDDPLEGGPQVEVEPVLAWGFTLGGTLVPITPLHRAGDWDQAPAIRKRGGKEIYWSKAIYVDEADFLRG